MHDRGVDVGDQALMASRSWRWLRVRILGLLDAKPTYVVIGDSLQVIHGSRLARDLHST